MKKAFYLLVLFISADLGSMAQNFATPDPEPVIREWSRQQWKGSGLTSRDRDEWRITSAHTDRKGVTYVYIQQEVNDLPVFGAVANFALRDGQVVHFGERFIRDAASQVTAAIPALSASDAIAYAADALQLPIPQLVEEGVATPAGVIFGPSGISQDPIPVKLIYQPVKGQGPRLAWDITIRSVVAPNWWHLAVDAATGEILRLHDLIVHCEQRPGMYSRSYNAMPDLQRPAPMMAPMPPDGSGYRVFPFPTESPIHGPHIWVTEPADVEASPFGWHDTNGAPGAESTTTRGNNVLASEDMDNNNVPGYSPDGGPSLNFDFPYAEGQTPLQYLDASITNLFHTCNVLHDVLYHYGFDEASGNFQVNNYGNGGFDADEVIAEAQDGGGSNNANFGTPPDGGNGRMQMYLWRTSGDSTFHVNTPSLLAGYYANVIAGFGPPLPAVPLTTDLALVQDAVPPVNDGCNTLLNAAELAGRIVLVDRGECTFVSKVQAIQNAGGLAVIVINNVPGDPIGMGGTGGGNIVIPSVMISQADGELLKNALLNGPVNATLVGPEEEEFRDSDLDNGIIAHEYGHGVSNRLTGGSFNVDCLWNEDQMGEGWSDHLGLVLTIQPGDGPSTVRGVGTFVRDQEVTGNGIRPAPYSTDPAVNDFTYGDTNDPALTQPHGVGFVWATMLWDLTWALIGEYGLDPDPYNGTGGNNMAIQLVLDGMKLQPCDPGFVDGRDAILLADELNYEGANECLIWNTFAQRGLGFSADQGSPYDRSDQVEAFDLPPACLSVGIGESGLPRSFRLAPNPAQAQVELLLGAPLATDAFVHLVAADGRKVTTKMLIAGSTRYHLDLAGLAPAVYVVELRIGDVQLKELLVVQ